MQGAPALRIEPACTWVPSLPSCPAHLAISARMCRRPLAAAASACCMISRVIPSTCRGTWSQGAGGGRSRHESRPVCGCVASRAGAAQGCTHRAPRPALLRARAARLCCGPPARCPLGGGGAGRSHAWRLLPQQEHRGLPGGGPPCPVPPCLDVHLEGGDAVLVARHLEVHVAQGILCSSRGWGVGAWHKRGSRRHTSASAMPGQPAARRTAAANGSQAPPLHGQGHVPCSAPAPDPRMSVSTTKRPSLSRMRPMATPATMRFRGTPGRAGRGEARARVGSAGCAGGAAFALRVRASLAPSPFCQSRQVESRILRASRAERSGSTALRKVGSN